MLSYLKEQNDFDVLFFTPNEDQNKVSIQFNKYKNPGILIDNSEIGPSWHIILFRTDEDINVKDMDQFEAIFSDPREYVSGLIDSDWYGVVAKKTTTSHQFMEEILDKFKKML